MKLFHDEDEWRIERLELLKRYRVTHLPCGASLEMCAEDYGAWGIPVYDDGKVAKVPSNFVCDRCHPVLLGKL